MKRSDLLEEARDHAIMGNTGAATLDMLMLIEQGLGRIARALERQATPCDCGRDVKPSVSRAGGSVLAGTDPGPPTRI